MPRGTNVDIEDDLYEQVKQMEPEGIPTKRKVNNLVRYAMNKLELLGKLFPKLSVFKADNLAIVIRDAKADNLTAEVRYDGNMLHCYKCDTKACEHIMYVLLLPELSDLRKK